MKDHSKTSKLAKLVFSLMKNAIPLVFGIGLAYGYNHFIGGNN